MMKPEPRLRTARRGGVPKNFSKNGSPGWAPSCTRVVLTLTTAGFSVLASPTHTGGGAAGAPTSGRSLHNGIGGPPPQANPPAAPASARAALSPAAGPQRTKQTRPPLPPLFLIPPPRQPRAGPSPRAPPPPRRGGRP